MSETSSGGVNRTIAVLPRSPVDLLGHVVCVSWLMIGADMEIEFGE